MSCADCGLVAALHWVFAARAAIEFAGALVAALVIGRQKDRVPKLSARALERPSKLGKPKVVAPHRDGATALDEGSVRSRP